MTSENTGYEGRRLPVYLLVDCSMAMAGAPIESVARAITKLIADLSVDAQVRQRTWLSVITFGEFAQQLCPLTPLESFLVPEFATGGRACLGNGLSLLNDCLDREVHKGGPGQKADWMPLIFILCSGRLEDDWQIAADGLARQQKVSPIIVCASLSEVNRSALSRFTDCVVDVGAGFDRVDLCGFFRLLSMSVASRSSTDTVWLAIDFGNTNTTAK